MSPQHTQDARDATEPSTPECGPTRILKLAATDYDGVIHIHIAAIDWEEMGREHPVVNGRDILPLAPLTILFGANDSGKSSTLRALASFMERISSGDKQLFGSVIMSFGGDTVALNAMLTDIARRRDTATSAGKWALEALADHPRLYTDSAADMAGMLAQAPVFSLDTDSDDGQSESEHLDASSQAGTWSVGIVDSPAHMAELPRPLLEVLRSLHIDPDERVRELEQLGLDPDAILHPLGSWHLGEMGRTSLPLLPQPLLLPQGVEVALHVLENAVERARRSFRAWAASVNLELPTEDPHNPWTYVDGQPDPFILKLVGALETLSSHLLPTFVRSTYRLDFDPSSRPKTPGITRLNARMSAVVSLLVHETFAKKFPIKEIASGFQLWVELTVWDLVAEANRTAASMRLAACNDIAQILGHPGSPAKRLEEIRLVSQRGADAHCASWLCHEQERSWQLNALATVPRDPRLVKALTETEAAVRPRMILIDEPERHLNAVVVKRAAAYLQQRARKGYDQIVIASHSPAFLSLRGVDVRHIHVRRVSNGLLYTTFAPSDQEALANVATGMRLDHGELLGLVAAIVWVEGPMDRAALEGLCGEQLQRHGARIATFGGLGNMPELLHNPLAKLPGLPFIVLVDDLDEEQLRRLQSGTAIVSPDDSQEMRKSTELLEKSDARRIEFVSHGTPDIIFALPDHALAEVAKSFWPGKEAVLRRATEAGIAKSGLKGFLAAEYGLKVNVASCRYAAEIASGHALPLWLGRLLTVVERAALRRESAT
ncbi:MAG TPA: hypothetical protein VGP18_08460 [Solirubrobacteraceae bacterium]|nr:hypothetical protein [Solirubrobacteraceae bacterium]